MKDYYEKQKFNSIWGYVIFALTVIFIYYSLATSQGLDNTVIIASISIALLILLIFEFCTLNTYINNKGISYKFWPFHRKIKVIPWAEVSEIQLQKYSPIKDYGGWGLRIGFKKGQAVNTKGNIGFLIKKKDGSQLMIGTQKPKQIHDTLINIKKVKYSLEIELEG